MTKKEELALIKEQAVKLAMGYKVETVHEDKNNNNITTHKTVDTHEVPGNVEALKVWKEICEAGN